MLSAISFNLNQSKILLSGTGLTAYKRTKCKLSKFKAFSEDKLNQTILTFNDLEEEGS